MSLIAKINTELDRTLLLLENYNDIGAVGQFATAHIKADRKKAQDALANGDVIAMLKILPILEDKR